MCVVVLLLRCFAIAISENICCDCGWVGSIRGGVFLFVLDLFSLSWPPVRVVLVMFFCFLLFATDVLDLSQHLASFSVTWLGVYL